MTGLLPLALSLLLGPASQDPARAESELARLKLHPEANLLLVEARIGDGGPLLLALDSGAGSVVLDSDAVEGLGLALGPVRKRPKGNREELTYRVAPSVTFRLASYEVALPGVVVTRCTPSAQMMIGKTVHGILGHAFFTRHVVAVDHDEAELVVHDPSTYRYDGDGVELELDFYAHPSNLPYTTLTIESRAGEAQELPMLVDSAGSVMGTLGFGLRSTVDRLVPDDAPRLMSVGATGLADTAEGSMHDVFVTRLHRVRLGPWAVDRPTVGCDATTRVGHDLFGARLLGRFHAVYDYRRSRLILEPNASFSAPVRADCAGMLLVAAEDDVSVRRVMFVAPSGPAHEAGLERDDVIVEIDGRPADAQSLHATRQLFCEPREFRLKVRRGEETRALTLRARELL